MNKLLIFLLLSISLNAISAQESSNSTSHRIFLVRHAEKANEDGYDPPLSKKGSKRAERLSVLLLDEGIGAIYSTNFIRTRSTAAPLATKLDIPIEIYDPYKSDILQTIRNTSENLLIIGHSNTVPNLINTLINDNKFEQLGDYEYDKLFILSRLDGDFDITIMEY